MSKTSRPVLGMLLLLGGSLLGCRPPGGEPGEVRNRDSAPQVQVLGTAQDGGLPHVACNCSHCEAARRDPARRRSVASLAILLPSSRRIYLIDATPDIREQLDALRGFSDAPAGRVDRAPVDGVFLTHAHLGHYTGLAFFGFEAAHTQNLPVYCSDRMAAFLRNNGPWSQLVSLGNVALNELDTDRSVDLGEGVTVSPILVPHRDEYADTLGFVVQGPTLRLLYVPDTDSWDAWSRSLPDTLQDIDVAILDGSFYSMDELPGRDVTEIGHPPITTSMELLEPTVREGRLEVYFTHLNHSNPALDPHGAARAEIERRGFHVLEDGRSFPL